jgi:hypothetical protein
VSGFSLIEASNNGIDPRLLFLVPLRVKLVETHNLRGTVGEKLQRHAEIIAWSDFEDSFSGQVRGCEARILQVFAIDEVDVGDTFLQRPELVSRAVRRRRFT